MERLPINLFPEYYASSIADFTNNEGIILRDHEEWLRGHIIRKVSFWVGYLAEVAGMSLARARWQIPVMVYLEIPSVSHWPAKDRFEDGEILTIFDQTGEMEMKIMGRAFESRGINPKAIKNYRWDNKHAILLLDYPLDPRFNSKYLVGIGNYLAPAFSTEEATEAVNNIPILKPQRMVN